MVYEIPSYSGLSPSNRNSFMSSTLPLDLYHARHLADMYSFDDVYIMIIIIVVICQSNISDVQPTCTVV